MDFLLNRLRDCYLQRGTVAFYISVSSPRLFKRHHS